VSLQSETAWRIVKICLFDYAMREKAELFLWEACGKVFDLKHHLADASMDSERHAAR